MKIINIASSDNFEDILEAVKESGSDSLILMVPKSNRVFKNKNKLDKLKAHFNKLKKEVSIISSGQKIPKNADEKKDKDLFSFYSGSFKERPVKPLPQDSKRFILILLGSAIGLFIFVALAFSSEVNIKIIPRKSDFSINLPVVVSDKITESDEVYGMVPGQYLELEKVVSKTFSSSAEKEVFQKAQGKVTIYNNFSPSSQILVATTRFQTAEGLVFRIPKTVTVPGLVKIGNESEPGEIEVEIIADRAGQEYNIEPSDFRIPGFLGSPKYQGFYAKSFEKFSGGFVGRSGFISQEDFEKAEKVLKDEGVKQVKTELTSLTNLILDEAVNIETEKTVDSARAGDLVKEFKIDLKIKAKAMVFKEDDIADFIFQYVKNSQDALAVKNGLKINYDQPKLDEEKKELSFKLAASGQTIQDIDKEKIISDIAGKKKDEADSYFSSLNEIESVRISSPFWMRRMPKNSDRIDIEIKVE